MSQQKTPETFRESWLITEGVFQVSQAGIDQVIADMFFSAFAVGFGSEIYSGLGDFEFVCSSTLADPFDHVPVTIARGKLHPRVNAGRIVTQQWLDETDLFEEIIPVER